MQRSIRLVRICYWWGILLDGVTAVLMFLPNLYLRVMHMSLIPDAGFAHALVMGAPVMAGWTVLLWWADHQPLARRDILILTVPVVLGYMLIEGFSVANGLTTFASAVPLLIMQTVLGVMYTVAYFQSGKLANQEC